MTNSHPAIVDETWSHLNKLIADAPCWTCRRRRLKCDNIKPACVKCTRAGIQCLGYGPKRPLAWVGLGRRTKPTHRLADSEKTGSNETAASPPSQTGEIAIRIADDETECFRILKSPSNFLFENYDSAALEYIQYYEQRCCMECSIYEENSVNPFRQFLPLMQSSPLVHHTIVSLAAHHRARCATPLRWPRRLSYCSNGSSKAEMSYNDMVSTQMLTSAHYASALDHKRRAIQHLRQALKSADYSDSVIVSTLLLIWVELLESGYKSWRYHLDGMRGLLTSRTKPGHVESNEASPLASSAIWSFEDYLEEKAHGHVLPSELGFHAAKLFDQLERFSCLDWAASYPQSSQTEQRNHLACAYKAAIKIYGLRALLWYDSEPTDMQEVVQNAVSHMEMISPQDNHFKGCLWPAFIVGAEASDITQRLAITSILLNMYNLLHTRNVEKGLQALERIWRQRESTDKKTSWIEDLCEDGEELLLV
ncbi:c6 finger domain-containing protein [Colletotrichum incanum]|uniref:C6 finger domain-containing protein n=1 Tax=Colletotrichum incanum TaxID=1573173 RepID=A0A167EG17_COLIC|nr:c6 finger domain-containing protein [Colletotrichum incanum]